MNVTIRRAVAADVAALADLAARTFFEAFAAENRPEDMALHSAQMYGVPQQGREVADPDITTLLVEADGQLAGYAQVRSGETPACVTGDAPVELWRFYVDQHWHGRGIPQALMQGVEDEVRARGGRTLWLGVWERNGRAKAFYGKQGFVDVGSHVYLVGADEQIDRIWVRGMA